MNVTASQQACWSELMRDLGGDAKAVCSRSTGKLDRLSAQRSILQTKMDLPSRSEVKPMAVRQPRYSKEEFAQRGDALYETEVRSQVAEGNHGKIVAIDIETGAFELANDTIVATDRLYERVPDAQPWVIRIGHRTVYRFGSRSLKKSV